VNLEPPDLATLRAYVSGTLAPDEAEAVRTWLIVAATEDVLELVDNLALAVEQARVRESYWATHPLRARLARLAWHARSKLGDLLELDLGDSPSLAAVLGEEPGHLVQPRLGGTVAVRPGSTVDLLVTPASHAWCGAYAVDSDDRLLVLAAAPAAHVAGMPFEIGTVALDAGDALDVFVVFDKDGPLPAPPEGADANWLADLLTAASESRAVFAATLVAESTGPGGKQT
jgi:hypothetical protein